MTQIIAFINQKGGVGKTTSTINIAACLSEEKSNEKVLIIDMDPQANCSQVYSSITDEDTSIYTLISEYIRVDQNLDNHTPLKKLIQPTYNKQLDILPANVLLSSAEIELVNAHSRETVLKRLLRDNKKTLDHYDYILIDCPPSLGLLTINAIIAADHLMVPLHADIFSLTGLELLTKTVTKLQEVFDCNCTILGFFFTQVSTEEPLFKEAFELCQENYGDLLCKHYIRTSPDIDLSIATNQSIIDYSPDADAAIDYQALSKECKSKVQKCLTY